MNLFVDSQISTVEPLKFGNGQVISSHTLPGMWLLIHGNKRSYWSGKKYKFLYYISSHDYCLKRHTDDSLNLSSYMLENIAHIQWQYWGKCVHTISRTKKAIIKIWKMWVASSENQENNVGTYVLINCTTYESYSLGDDIEHVTTKFSDAYTSLCYKKSKDSDP